MKLFQICLILVTLLAIYAEASNLKRRLMSIDADGDGVDDTSDDVPDDMDDGDDTEEIVHTNVDNGDDEIKDLKTVAIKSRVITLDRELCREQSRYHPHYPKCQMYCENLKHWMGMCRRDTCHCYS
ncbi:uncharacterized protein LOC101889651 [Musca domestica]|uniref:Uncharacterized protein LOC101889651 n=1 Tax=Musca domestica TaxID=7370 RepID=A0A1I8M5G0_MUSDO|nr:uncharacterized protein LOC101889651 [Musca domestica]